MNAFRKFALLGILAAGGTLALCEPAVAQAGWPSKWELTLDSKRASQVFEKSVSFPDVWRVLSAALSVRAEGDPDIPLAATLYAFRVRDRKVISTFQSKPFSIEPGRANPVPGSALPSEQWFGDAARAGSDGFLVARKPLPGDLAVGEPLRFILDGVFPDKPPDWERREMVYLVAMPASDGSDKDAAVINHEEQYTTETSPMLVMLQIAGRGR